VLPDRSLKEKAQQALWQNTPHTPHFYFYGRAFGGWTRVRQRNERVVDQERPVTCPQSRQVAGTLKQHEAKCTEPYANPDLNAMSTFVIL
jgi:hypothetical protein